MNDKKKPPIVDASADWVRMPPDWVRAIHNPPREEFSNKGNNAKARPKNRYKLGSLPRIRAALKWKIHHAAHLDTDYSRFVNKPSSFYVQHGTWKEIDNSPFARLLMRLMWKGVLYAFCVWLAIQIFSYIMSA